MKKILAVSGGVDSMVLLDIFKNDKDVIVAHFNHGTRPSADDDQKFVERAAKDYHLPFFTQKANLGSHVSEMSARAARYDFLRSVAKEQNGQIYTAHHLNDLAESVAINLLRGTGWRGLAALNAQDIVRPFLLSDFLGKPFTKNDILRYAAEHEISFREDPTNSEPNYLRNRLRPLIKNNEQISQLYILWQKQIELKKEIDCITKPFINQNAYSRDFFASLDEPVARELLRAILLSRGQSLTRPQIDDLLLAVKTYKPGKLFNLPNNRFVTIKSHSFFF